MNTVYISDIFNIVYGNSYALKDLEIQEDGVSFIARGSQNNGVVAYVARTNEKPFQPGSLTVSLGGSVLETFYQPQPFYTSYHIKVLVPKNNMNIKELLYYCMAIKANKYRYNYGRQANKTLAQILVPHPNFLPEYVHDLSLKEIRGTMINKIDEIFNESS